MAYEQKDLTGSLFKNDRKEADTHPDYKGSALLNGVDHWVDAWVNTDRNGGKYMSLKFKPKDGARAPVQQQDRGAGAVARTGPPQQAYAAPDLDDGSDIPF